MKSSSAYQLNLKKSYSEQSDVSNVDESNGKKSGVDLDKFLEIQNNRINVGAKIKQNHKKSGLIITE
jgi:hypothetical protein